MKEIFKKRREYMKKSIALRNSDSKYLSYENSRKLCKEQDEYYKRFLFFKNLDNAMRCIEKC